MLRTSTTNKPTTTYKLIYQTRRPTKKITIKHLTKECLKRPLSSWKTSIWQIRAMRRQMLVSARNVWRIWLERLLNNNNKSLPNQFQELKFSQMTLTELRIRMRGMMRRMVMRLTHPWSSRQTVQITYSEILHLESRMLWSQGVLHYLS